VLTLEEDLVLVFSTKVDWRLVCKTSVRLITRQDQDSRIDLGDIVERARWTKGHLHVEDAGRPYPLGTLRGVRHHRGREAADDLRH
jgi:hypothetical protein